jgi:hypothetical protein
LFAVYTTMTCLLDYPFMDFATARVPNSAQKYASLLYFPWMMKPLYGFLADVVAPFYFKIKGYVVIIGLLNLLLALVTAGSLHHLDSLDSTSSSTCLTIVLFVIYLNQSFIDAICRTRG